MVQGIHRSMQALEDTCMCMRVCVWFVTAVSVSYYIFLRCSVSHYVSLLFTFIYSLPAILAKTASGCQISVAMCATFQPFFCEPNAVPVVARSASVASRPGVGLTNSFMLLLPTNSMGWGVPHFLKHVGRLMPPSFEVLGSVASCNRSDSAGVIATDGHWFAERTMCGMASEKVPVDVRDKASRHFPVFCLQWNPALPKTSESVPFLPRENFVRPLPSGAIKRGCKIP